VVCKLAVRSLRELGTAVPVMFLAKIQGALGTESNSRRSSFLLADSKSCIHTFH
jgi:hypothetical protein